MEAQGHGAWALDPYLQTLGRGQGSGLQALQAGLKGGVGLVSCFLSDSHHQLGTEAGSTLAAPSPEGGEGFKAWQRHTQGPIDLAPVKLPGPATDTPTPTPSCCLQAVLGHLLLVPWRGFFSRMAGLRPGAQAGS